MALRCRVRKLHQLSEKPVKWVLLGQALKPDFQDITYLFIHQKIFAWIRRDLDMWAEHSRHMLEVTHMVMLQD